MLYFASQIDGNYGAKFVSDDPSTLAIYDYQYFRDNLLREDDASSMMKYWLKGTSLEDSTIFSLEELANKLLSRKNTAIDVKPVLLNTWLALIGKIDPSWVLASVYSTHLHRGIVTPQQLLLLDGSQCPLALAANKTQQHFADNHVHLGGNGHTALSMLDIVFYMKKRPTPNNWPTIPEMTLLNSKSVDINSIPLLINMLFQYLFRVLIKNENSSSFYNLDETFWQSGEGNLIVLENSLDMSISMQLLRSAHQGKVSAEHRWLLLTTALTYAVKYESLSAQFKAGFNAFVHATNIFRSAMIFSGIGLSHFVDCFDFKLRKPQQYTGQYDYENTALFRDGGKNTFREFKTGPSIVLTHKGSRCVLDVHWLKGIAVKLINSGVPENRHFAIHFFRSLSPGTKKNDKLQATVRNLMLKQTRVIQQFFSSLELQCCILRDEKHRDHIVNLSNLVRGLDLAGNENDLPIEVFSPYIRVLRSNLLSNDSIFFDKSSELHLTIHAGEDYSHIISGLRAIDETIEFCDYQTGDRIGHGLALGVDPKEWANRQQQVYLPAGEYLDNLVWLHHKALSVVQLVPRFTVQVSLLERKIESWSEYVYGECLSPNTLYEAWKLRKNCPIIADLPNHAYGTEWEFWVPNFEHINKKEKSKAYIVWKQYLDSGQLNCNAPNYFDLVSLRFISSPDEEPDIENLTDVITTETLDLITAVQDYLIEAYSHKGLIIEACPTSNISIGRLKEYKEHPIFRWNPPDISWLMPEEKFNQFGIRKGPLSVCINTDDSAIMPTTIENEHRVLKETAEQAYKIAAWDSEKWIDCIRAKGVEIFNISHQNWVLSESCKKASI